MSRFKRAQPGAAQLEIRTDQIDTTSFGDEPDAGWKYIDAAGHGHYYYHGYPTVKEITETEYDEDGEWQRHIRWECPHCGEVIVPTRKLTGASRTSIPGARHYLIDGEEVSREAFIPAWRERHLALLAETEMDL